MMNVAPAHRVNGVIEAWSKYEGELRGFLIQQLHDHPLAEDLLQAYQLVSQREHQSCLFGIFLSRLAALNRMTSISSIISS